MNVPMNIPLIVTTHNPTGGYSKLSSCAKKRFTQQLKVLFGANMLTHEYTFCNGFIKVSFVISLC